MVNLDLILFLSFFSSTLMKLGSFLVVVGIIVFVHELGHFIAAKSVGIRVIRFSIGFPPRLFSWKSKGTDFQIGAIPFGGYVKMAGVIDESWGDKESAITGAPDEFTSKNVFQKTWVLSAGVLFNIVFAWLLAIIISFFQGKPLVAEPVVGNVVENLPAAIDLKLQENDRIIQIDTVPIHHWNDITSIIHTHPNKNLSFVWVRGNDTLTGITSPIERPINTDDGTIRKVGLIGISPKVQYADISLIEAIQIGSQMTWFIIKNTFIGFYNLFTGTSTIKELVGPIGIVKLSGESVQSGTSSFFSFILLISISVGLINILPIPMLDGGHILIAWIEAIRRKSISIEWKIRIQKIGMIFLLLLIIWVSYHDILRLWSNP